MKNLGSRLVVLAPAVLAVILLVSGIAFFLTGKPPDDESQKKHQYTDLKVVQFYLHLPDGDYIIGRERKENYSKVIAAVTKVALAINAPAGTGIVPEAIPAQGGSLTVEDSVVQGIRASGVTLSVWLIEPHMISTSIKQKSYFKRDEYGNQILETDRLMIVLGGRYKGLVFSRNPAAESWWVWESGREEIVALTELVRKGGL